MRSETWKENTDGKNLYYLPARQEGNYNKNGREIPNRTRPAFSESTKTHDSGTPCKRTSVRGPVYQGRGGKPQIDLVISTSLHREYVRLGKVQGGCPGASVEP